ncbi:hypothetical protein LZC95_50820 [Pendulispora brunnea]|uniref:ACT domain-containing protein n=1 Tax=Pendulispora brunnea TaxID=2905690 RepID=A0ABZ2KEB5_9BACT
MIEDDGAVTDVRFDKGRVLVRLAGILTHGSVAARLFESLEANDVEIDALTVNEADGITHIAFAVSGRDVGLVKFVVQTMGEEFKHWHTTYETNVDCVTILGTGFRSHAQAVVNALRILAAERRAMHGLTHSGQRIMCLVAGEKAEKGRRSA